MSNSFGGTTVGTNYRGNRAAQPPDWNFFPRDPNQFDTLSYQVGDLWLNTITEQPWILVSLEGTSQSKGMLATWIMFGGNFFADEFPTDAGIAIPAAGVLNIFGGPNINTSGSGNTVDVNLNTSILQPPTNSSGTTGVYALGTTGFANDRFLYAFGPTNTFCGYQSGNLTLTPGTAIQNTGIGNVALSSLTVAFGNTAVGWMAGSSLTTGETNTAVGSQALASDTAGAQNVAIGVQAMVNTLGAFQNVAIGAQALVASQGGTTNICVGHNAGNGYLGDESSNIIIGVFGGVLGEDNTIRITTPTNTNNNNIFIGQNNPGASITIANATSNIGLGNNTFIGLTTGAGNTAIGASSEMSLSTGSRNTSIGIQSLQNISSGSFNVCIGQAAGINYTAAESSNIIIGSSGTSGESNAIRIGGSGTGSGQQNYCNIAGIRGITTVNANAIPVLIDSSGQLGTVSSSLRYKDNIKPIFYDSHNILKLNPVKFNYKKHTEDNISYGLIAEHVHEIMPQLVVYDSEGHPETVKYLDLIPLMLNELQRLNEKVKLLETR
jgi:hypothetical protein